MDDEELIILRAQAEHTEAQDETECTAGDERFMAV